MSITPRVALRILVSCVLGVVTSAAVTGCGIASKAHAAQATKVKDVRVNAKPTGPPTPRGGWSVAYADGFGAELGTRKGQDNTWRKLDDEEGFTNENEIAVFRAKQAKTGAEGLELACTPLAREIKRGAQLNAYYECGAVVSTHFRWKSDEGETWAFECVCKWPANTGEADPGWWTNGGYREGENEYDFFEGDGWGNHDAEYDAFMPAIVQLGEEHKVDGFEKTLGFYPEQGLHRYTTVLTPHGGHYTAEEYVDGTFKWSFSYTDTKQAWDELNLSYALREYTGGFRSGTRDFDIRSVAVYEGKAHEGKDIEGGGVAPGTVVG
jgi:hypothetical protein